MSLADELLKPDDLPAVAVVVPEWNRTVHVATLRADERDQLETDWLAYKETSGQGDNVGFRAFVCAFCLCDEARNKLYTGDKFEAAVKALRGKLAGAVNRIFDKAAKLNGLTRQDQEELQKN